MGQPEHVIQFMFAEMGTTGSVDGAGRLVIKGRFQQKQVENVLRRYIGLSPKVLRDLPLVYSAYSRIRDMQNVQIARHPLDEGESYLFHGVRVVWE